MLGWPEPLTPAAPAPVRRAPAPRPEPRRQATRRPPKRSGASRFARFLGFILLVLILAAIIAAVVLLLTDSSSKTDIGQYIKDNVPDQVKSVIQFIKDHTG